MSFKNLGDELKNIKELKDLFANGETLKSVKKNSPEQYKKLLSYANGKNLDDYLETLNEFGLSNKDKKKLVQQARKSGNLDVSKKDIKKAFKQGDLAKVYHGWQQMEQQRLFVFQELCIVAEQNRRFENIWWKIIM